METNEYVLVYARLVNTKGDKVLLIQKNRPEWQKGKLNLLGGKIDEGEDPADTAVRELREEGGIEPAVKHNCAEHVGMLVGSWGRIWVYKIPVLYAEPVSGDEGVVSWHRWDEVKKNPALVPNLKIIIPLIAMGVKGWIVNCEGSGENLLVSVSRSV